MSDGALWAWAVAYYDRPGVAPALLALQARAGVDVPLLLWRIWRIETGRAASSAHDAEAAALSAGWRADVVGPLRAARDALKVPPEGIDANEAAALRKSVLAVELSAERLQLGALEALCGPPGAPEASPERLEKLKSLPELAHATEAEFSTLIAALDEL